MIEHLSIYAEYLAGRRQVQVYKMMDELHVESKIKTESILRAMGWQSGKKYERIGRYWIKAPKAPDLKLFVAYLTNRDRTTIPDVMEATALSKVMCESILRAMGWASTGKYIKTQAGGKACAWTYSGFYPDLHEKEKTDTLSSGGKVRPKSLRERKTSIKFTLSTPLCAPSPRDYELWRNAARSTTTPRFGYCTDCRPEYQAKMRRLNRCENTHVLFRPDPDDPEEFEGYVPAEEQ